MPLIKSIMTPFPYSVDVADSVNSASRMMNDHEIRHLPVTDKGKLVGVISDRDIKRVLDGADEGDGVSEVGDIAHLDSYVVDLTAPLDAVVLEMARRHIATGLVVKDGRLVGIFTSTDVYTYLGKMLKTLFPRGSDDAA